MCKSCEGEGLISKDVHLKVMVQAAADYGKNGDNLYC